MPFSARFATFSMEMPAAGLPMPPPRRCHTLSPFFACYVVVDFHRHAIADALPLLLSRHAAMMMLLLLLMRSRR